MSYLVAKEALVPLWILIGATIALTSIMYILIKALNDVMDQTSLSLPSIRAVVPDPEGGDKPILLLEPSDLFGISSRVSIYHQFADTDYELLIGYGAVLTVQGDRRIQIKVEEWVGDNDQIVSGINNQTEKYLSGTTVKPSAPYSQDEGKRVGLSSIEIDRIFQLAQVLQAQSGQVGTLIDKETDDE